uniref:Uncharacterized protein n=1 Tax=Timema monikensis TaxID=170555 RepID=A0A7R9DZ83_9NEOP|nr:unnamed protein product [Timema monikensis]
MFAKRVVTCYDLDCINIEDICNELAPQHVTEGLTPSLKSPPPPVPPRSPPRGTPPNSPWGPKLCATIVEPFYPAFGTLEVGMSGGTGEATKTLPSMETSHSNIDDVSIEQNHHNSSLNLNMTAKELRAQLASRKKYDPKKESMDFKKKYDIVQKL